MTRCEKMTDRILRGTSDADIAFSDLCRLLKRLDFDERVRGSHHIFRKVGVDERINLQESGTQAKPYQVRQVRDVLVRYKLVDDS